MYHSTLGVRAIKKKKKKYRVWGAGGSSGETDFPLESGNETFYTIASDK